MHLFRSFTGYLITAFYVSAMSEEDAYIYDTRSYLREIAQHPDCKELYATMRAIDKVHTAILIRSYDSLQVQDQYITDFPFDCYEIKYKIRPWEMPFKGLIFDDFTVTPSTDINIPTLDYIKQRYESMHAAIRLRQDQLMPRFKKLNVLAFKLFKEFSEVFGKLYNCPPQNIPIYYEEESEFLNVFKYRSIIEKIPEIEKELLSMANNPGCDIEKSTLAKKILHIFKFYLSFITADNEHFATLLAFRMITRCCYTACIDSINSAMGDTKDQEQNKQQINEKLVELITDKTYTYRIKQVLEDYTYSVKDIAELLRLQWIVKIAKSPCCTN